MATILLMCFLAAPCQTISYSSMTACQQAKAVLIVSASNQGTRFPFIECVVQN